MNDLNWGIIGVVADRQHGRSTDAAKQTLIQFR